MATGAGSIYGCPISSFVAFESACSVTNVPACETASPVVYDKACCNSIEDYGSSLLACFKKSAPSCLNTSQLLASGSSYTGTGTYTNPCAAYITGGGGVQATTSGSASQATKTGSSANAKTTQSGSIATGGTQSTGTSSASTSSSTAKSNSAVSTVGAGLKVYIGVALIGALAVLNL